MAHDATQTTSSWRRVASLAGAVVLGAVLLAASLAKALDPDAFALQISAEKLDFLLPAAMVALLALAIEFFLGTALLLGVRHRAILWPSAFLVVFFVFLTGRTYWSHLQGIEPADTNCGCFGRLVERTPGEAFWQDLLLLVPPLLLAFLVRETKLGRGRLMAAAILTVAGTLFAWQAPRLPLDNLVTALKPDVATAGLCVGNADKGSRVCLDDVVPELAEKSHLVILADPNDPAFGAQVAQLNDFHWSSGVPSLWVLSAASADDLFKFRFEKGPSFEIRETPAPLIRSMSRRLPRSFLVENGQVSETWSALPPLERWSAASAQK
jgi:uncharacterized membrane protein YphA (DoxX/SURF4 family)